MIFLFSAILLTDRLLIWLENCTVCDERRATVEFGYSHGYCLAFIRKIVIIQSKFVKLTLGTPNDPQILSLLFEFRGIPHMDAVNQIKSRTQILITEMKRKAAEQAKEASQSTNSTEQNS